MLTVIHRQKVNTLRGRRWIETRLIYTNRIYNKVIIINAGTMHIYICLICFQYEELVVNRFNVKLFIFRLYSFNVSNFPCLQRSDWIYIINLLLVELWVVNDWKCRIVSFIQLDSRFGKRAQASKIRDILKRADHKLNWK